MTPSVSPEAERELSEGALLPFSADALQPLERRGQVENTAAREAAKGYELRPAVERFGGSCHPIMT